MIFGSNFIHLFAFGSFESIKITALSDSPNFSVPDKDVRESYLFCRILIVSRMCFQIAVAESRSIGLSGSSAQVTLKMGLSRPSKISQV